MINFIKKIIDKLQNLPTALLVVFLFIFSIADIAFISGIPNIIDRQRALEYGTEVNAKIVSYQGNGSQNESYSLSYKYIDENNVVYEGPWISVDTIQEAEALRGTEILIKIYKGKSCAVDFRPNLMQNIVLSIITSFIILILLGLLHLKIKARLR